MTGTWWSYLVMVDYAGQGVPTKISTLCQILRETQLMTINLEGHCQYISLQYISCNHYFKIDQGLSNI